MILSFVAEAAYLSALLAMLSERAGVGTDDESRVTIAEPIDSTVSLQVTVPLFVQRDGRYICLTPPARRNGRQRPSR